METLTIIAVLAIVLCSYTCQGILLFVALRYFKQVKDSPIVAPTEAPKRTEAPTTDIYTPQYSDRSVPLDEFVPDFSKPINLKIKTEIDENGNRVTKFD